MNLPLYRSSSRNSSAYMDEGAEEFVSEWLPDIDFLELPLLPALLLGLLLLILLRRRRGIYRSSKSIVLHPLDDRRGHGGSSSAYNSSNSLRDGACQPNVEKYSTLSEVKYALRKSGLESANLIFGIDFTASNRFQGARSFGGRCLHDVSSGGLNPYQSVIFTLCETMETFQTDGHIPAFGFGDCRYKNGAVFPLGPDETCCGFQGVYRAYCERAITAQLGGPTNFAPLIDKAAQICKATNAYHILVIVADGQVICERDTVEAIERASFWPLSIITIGVGDGPWDMMEEFDKQLPQRNFDNFRFVNYHEAVSRNKKHPEIAFAVAALMEIPDQYTAIRRLDLLDAGEQQR